MVNVLRYHIYFSTTTGVTTDDTRIQVAAGNTTYVHTGRTNGTTYYYKIASVGPGGEGTLSSEVSATPTDYANNFSMTFDGVDERLLMGDVLDPATGDFSASAWVKVASGATSGIDAIVVGKWDTSVADGWMIEVKNNNFIAQFFTSATATKAVTAANVSNSTWQHIAAVFDRDGNITCYVNGASSGTPTSIAAGSAININNSNQFAIGGKGSASPADLFPGKIDEVSYWDKALSAAEVTEIYNSGVPADLLTHSAAANLEGWWRMGDDASFPTIPDQSTNSNDGTASNMEAGDITSDVPS